MCPSPPLDASVPTARAKRYDLVAGCYPANATNALDIFIGSLPISLSIWNDDGKFCFFGT